MRIQDTDRILKEARHARQAASHQEDHGFVSRAWRALSSLPERVGGLFKRHS